MERKQLVNAARDLNKTLELSPSIDVSGSVAEIRKSVLEAAELLTDKDPVQGSTREVLAALRDGSAVNDTTDSGGEVDGGTTTKTKKGKVAKAPKAAKEPKAPKEPKVRQPRGTKVEVGAFKPVRAGTKYEALIGMADRGDTVQQMADAYKVKRTDVLWYFRYPLRRDHGIDFRVLDDGKVELMLPSGKTLADCVVQTKAA